MDEQHWQRHSYLDLLRPPDGWHVQFAVLATYSADLVASVAALLALAGIEEDGQSATKVDFANAYEAMRGKVRILVQRGRLACPRQHAPILAIMDRFFREIGSDEATASWHPKIALVKLASTNGGRQWRLWLGSRNLTRSVSWEAGLMLLGSDSSQGVRIPGSGALGKELMHHAELEGLAPDVIAAELAQVRWQTPPGTTLKDLRLLLSSTRPYPSAQDNVDELIIVSPFLDATTLRHFAGWGTQDTKRTIVSLQSQLAEVYGRSPGVLSQWRLLHLAPPEPVDVEIATGETSELEHEAGGDDEQGVEVDNEETSWEDGVIEPLGLHAKLVYAASKERRSLWLGSANATRRGWRGPNVEIVAHLDITETTANGLHTFVNEVAQTVDEATLAQLAREEEKGESAEELERARSQVAARWSVIQKRADSDYLLHAEKPPHPDQIDIGLEVGLLGEEMVAWPRGIQEVLLRPTRAIESEFVQVRLRYEELKMEWLQRAPLVPPPDIERDRRAMARHLDPRTFLLWIRSLLGDGDISDGGGPWHMSNSIKSGRGNGLVWWAPTLEDLLKSWSRRPDTLYEVDRKVQQYLTFIQEDGLDDMGANDQALIDAFAETWETVRQILVDEPHE